MHCLGKTLFFRSLRLSWSKYIGEVVLRSADYLNYFDFVSSCKMGAQTVWVASAAREILAK